MTPPVPPAYQVLDRVLTRELPVREFEGWVYDSPELETELGARDYLRLLEFDYGQPDAGHELDRIVAGIYERKRPGMLVPDRVWRLACGLSTGTLPLARTVDQLASLWWSGHEWIPIDFVGISSDMDHVPRPAQHPLWNPAALASRLEEWQPDLDHLATVAAEAARLLLRERYPGAPCPGGPAHRAP
jgi:hypothetical protein